MFQNYIERWIESIVREGIVIKSIFLDIHYMYDKVNDMAKLLDKINWTSFLQDDGISTFNVASTIHIIKKVLVMWKDSN
jgi:hypothetical protein